LISKAKPPKPKRRKKSLIQEPDEIPPTHIENSKALLNMMNTNIKAMRRIRHTHSKFAALNATTLTNEDTEEGGGGGGGSGGTSGMPGVGLSGASGFGSNDSLGGAGENSMMASADDEILNEKVDERPWVMMMQSKGKKSKGKEKIARVGGVEIGQKNSWGCMQWTNTKILEHVGFQGTFFFFWRCRLVLFTLFFSGASQVALDVMAGVMAEYISNVGRTIKYLCDQRPTTMTPEVT
jgi:transcriptional activator SPT7